MIELEPNACKCGHMPEIYTQFPVAKGKYRGYVECPECGEIVYGGQWHYDKDDAAEDAVEEWNKKMGEQNDEDSERVDC